MNPRLILSANAAPRQGGQGLNLHHMLEGLREAFDVTAYCRAPCEGLSTVVIPPSSLARWAGRTPLLRRCRDWLTWLGDAHHDRAVARRLGQADVFQGAVGQSLDSLRAARKAGCRTVLDVVTLHVEEFDRHQRRECGQFGIRSTIHPRHRRRIEEEYRQADLIRVMSDVARRTFLERGFAEDRVFTARPPFDLVEFPEARFEGGKFRVGFAGLIEPWKGFHYLVEAFRSWPNPEAELVLWGGPGSRPVSEYLAEATASDPRIRVEPVEIRKAGFAQTYASCSVYVHPSLCDGFGYVVGEAMACGVPAVVTSTTGASDLVRDGVNGWVVPPGDAGAIRDRLDYLARNPDQRAKMGRSAREAVAGLTMEQFRAAHARRLLTLAAG